jgi:hypothetical protein
MRPQPRRGLYILKGTCRSSNLDTITLGHIFLTSVCFFVSYSRLIYMQLGYLYPSVERHATISI